MDIQELISTLESTFRQDFTNAEKHWTDAVIKLCSENFNKYKKDIKNLTELVLVMNWKIWERYEENVEIAQVYDKLWRDLDERCCNNLKGEDAKYYYKKTD